MAISDKFHDFGSVVLQVKEAKKRDIGRGIARISQKAMQKLGVNAGDVIEICGVRTSSANAWPPYKEDANQDIIRIDHFIRDNCGAAIDSYVTVKKALVKEATELVLAPLNIELNVDEDFTQFVKNRLKEL